MKEMVNCFTLCRKKWHNKSMSCYLHMAIGNRANKMSYVIGNMTDYGV